MFLYHGSNTEVRYPKILVTNRALDFGAGFYTTSDKDQAIRWARLQAIRRRSGKPSISIYDFDESALSKMCVLHFDHADTSWLRFVSQNRKNAYSEQKYDIVYGPVANDNTMPVINDYIAGTIDEETALILLKPQKLADQYAFLTQTGLSALRFLEVMKDA